MTASYCRGISNNSCSVNAAQTNCVAKKDSCSEYTILSECFDALNEGFCVLNAAGDTCIKYNYSDPCSAIKIYGFTNNYTNYKC